MKDFTTIHHKTELLSGSVYVARTSGGIYFMFQSKVSMPIKYFKCVEHEETRLLQMYSGFDIHTTQHNYQYRLANLWETNQYWKNYNAGKRDALEVFCEELLPKKSTEIIDDTIGKTFKKYGSHINVREKTKTGVVYLAKTSCKVPVYYLVQAVGTDTWFDNTSQGLYTGFSWSTAYSYREASENETKNYKAWIRGGDKKATVTFCDELLPKPVKEEKLEYTVGKTFQLIGTNRQLKLGHIYIAMSSDTSKATQYIFKYLKEEEDSPRMSTLNSVQRFSIRSSNDSSKLQRDFSFSKSYTYREASETESKRFFIARDRGHKEDQECLLDEQQGVKERTELRKQQDQEEEILRQQRKTARFAAAYGAEGQPLKGLWVEDPNFHQRIFSKPVTPKEAYQAPLNIELEEEEEYILSAKTVVQVYNIAIEE